MSFPPTGETSSSSLVSLVSRFLIPFRIGKRIGHLPAVLERKEHVLVGRVLTEAESSLAALEIRRCTDLSDGPHG